MIQDIYPHVLNNRYANRRDPVQTDQVFLFEANSVLVKTEGEHIELPEVKDIDTENLIYLFSIDETAYYMCESNVKAPDGYEYAEMRALMSVQWEPEYTAYALMTGYHLYDWYRNNRYCGHCGHEMIHDDTERAQLCPECGHKEYPRINPAVIVGVINGDQILLTRYRIRGNMNALVAGFTEIGETREQTVAREVMEETGLKVKNIRYYKSQPWGIAQDLLMGFYCDVDGDDAITMDTGELKYACWVSREDIVLQPRNYSLTNEMMKRFKEGLSR